MIVQPKVKGFICTTAHPAGCEKNVLEQIDYVKKQGKIDGAKKVLVIGASTGYGLASRITAAFGMGAATIGVLFDKEASGKRTATPGFYNTRAFDREAKRQGIYSKSINGDAFSKEIKEQVIRTIKEDLGKVDLVVYSLASPRRTTADGTTYVSAIKTIGEPFTQKNWNLRDDTIAEATVPAATDEEINSTVKVMGGEDWIDWIDALAEADAIEEHAVTIAYSYIGPKLTYPIYHEGTIGRAKKHLAESAGVITDRQKAKDIRAYVSVNKALVTQASSAIPVVPLYLSVLYRVMKEKNIHEGCIEQMYRLYRDKVFKGNAAETEEDGMLHVDDWEMREDVQKEVMEIWNKIDSGNLQELADTEGYWNDFYRMFGFKVEGVDYSLEVEV
ncbi:MAG: trans-2-enoyl-CoA reductase family protein [Bacteroidales bacterium]|nr:trans-2-enoyl-CoA reductase family protein [Clostridium sp.]MCM1203875.1 trans-2-enoyl-CoA reductase family protein [Bacteroidales bacterium]